MDKQQQIRDRLNEIAKKHAKQSNTLLAIVASVDVTDFTCVLTDDDNDGTVYTDVRLRPVLDGNEALTIFPKQGTWALATRIEDDEEWMIIAVGEAATYRIKLGTLLFEIDTASGKFVIANGTDNLKDVIRLVIEAVMQIVVMMGNNPDYVKLQQAATKLNNLM